MIFYIYTLPFSILFSIPDARVFGFTTQTILFFYLLLIIIFDLTFNKLIIYKGYIKYNISFIYLLIYSILIVLIYSARHFTSDLHYILSSNKDLLMEIMLSYLIFSITKRSSLNVIRKFIEIYFFLNFVYLIITLIFPGIASLFHQSVENIDHFTNTREPLLGWEPSYTVPVNILFAVVYMAISKYKWILFLIIIFTSYSFYLGESKTGYIQLFISIFLFFYFKYLSMFKNKFFISLFFIILFSVISFFTITFLDDKLGYTKFDSRDKLHQYEVISFVTRSELITVTLQEIFHNPLGYGHGTSVIYLSEKIDKNINNFNSFEIQESNKYGRTSKSQFLQYVFSGGVIFFILFFMQIVFLLYKINSLDNRTRNLLKTALILSITTILIGERIPYILLINFIWQITLFQNKTNVTRNEYLH